MLSYTKVSHTIMSTYLWSYHSNYLLPSPAFTYNCGPRHKNNKHHSNANRAWLKGETPAQYYWTNNVKDRHQTLAKSFIWTPSTTNFVYLQCLYVLQVYSDYLQFWLIKWKKNSFVTNQKENFLFLSHSNSWLWSKR